MTAPQQPAPTQDPAQVPVQAPAPEGASGPAPEDGEDDSERAKIWPPPPEKLLEFMMGARFSIIEEPGGEQADNADRQAAPSPGTTPPAPAQPAPPQQAPVKE